MGLVEYLGNLGLGTGFRGDRITTAAVFMNKYFNLSTQPLLNRATETIWPNLLCLTLIYTGWGLFRINATRKWYTVATAKLHPAKLRRFFDLVSRRNLGVGHCQTAPRYQKTRLASCISFKSRLFGSIHPLNNVLHKLNRFFGPLPNCAVPLNFAVFELLLRRTLAVAIVN